MSYTETQNAAGTRERILRVAERFFAERGYEGTSTRMIAEEAGVNKAMIFYYFRNKEDLYFQVLSDLFTSLTTRLFPIFRARMPYEKKIERFVDEVFTFFSTRPTFCKITQRESVNPRKRYKEFIVQNLRPLYNEGRKFLVERARVEDPDNLIFSGYGMIMSYFNEAEFIGMLMGREALDRSALKKRREHVKKAILNLVRAFS